MSYPAPLPALTHRIMEATVAHYDDEAGWREGRRLEPAEIGRLNQLVEADLGAVISIEDPDTSWIVTFGQGQEYSVEPADTCGICGKSMHFAETHEADPVHVICYHRNWDR